MVRFQKIIMDPTSVEEIETLKAIYGDDLECEVLESGSALVRMALTGNEVGASWFSTSLEFMLSPQYPNAPPSRVSLRHPRGLNETEINGCLAAAKQIFDDDRGSAVENDDSEPRHLLYDAIESVREYLSKRSGLSLPCPICLYGFVAEDAVSVTAECSHHFHTYCLARYVAHSRSEQERERALYGRTNQEKEETFYCPVCRAVIDTSAIGLENDESQPKSWLAPESPSGGVNVDLSSLSNPIERNYKEMWEKQKRNGGLIDLQREKDRFLVTEHTRLPTTGQTRIAANFNPSESS